MKPITYLAKRLREPSTLAGLAAILALFGAPAGVPEAVAQLVGAVSGLAAVLMPERGA